jgi:zinc protease
MMNRIAALSAVAALSSVAWAQPGLPKGFARGATVEGITEYRLENGLRVLLFPDPSKPKVTVNVTYMVGSKHENYGETGMAHAPAVQGHGQVSQDHAASEGPRRALQRVHVV